MSQNSTNQVNLKTTIPDKKNFLIVLPVLAALAFCTYIRTDTPQKINTKEKKDADSITAKHPDKSAEHIFFKTKKATDTINVDQLKQSNWYATAMKNIEEAEYHFNKVENTNTYSTPNRKNNLRFYYDENGFTVEPRTTKIPIGDYDEAKTPAEIKYKTLPNWKVAFNLDKKQVGNGVWLINNNKAEYKTDNITVQYINNEEGMRQNFIVQSQLSGNKNLKINFSVQTTLQHQLQNNRLQFTDKKSTAVLNYEQLKVWDANGVPLAASFEKNNNDYCINVNTVNATYPITIDPISSTPAAMVESNKAGAYFGRRVAAAGDVNGDGYGDVIVGAHLYDNGQTDEGAAFIYHGSAIGISTTPVAIMEGSQTSAQLGTSVACAGDVNGDGYSDIIVGAWRYDNGQTNEGAAFVYHGSATGINPNVRWLLQDNLTSTYFGTSVASAGDVNGDGYCDVIVGATHVNTTGPEQGAAFIFHGSAAGVISPAAKIIRGNKDYARFGYAVAGAGDVNGDGYSDVIVGAFLWDVEGFWEPGSAVQLNEGAAFIYHGSATGVSTTAAAMVQSNQADANMGISVSGAGDVNGDGYSDVIVGGHNYNSGQTDEGAAFVYHGSATGISTTAAAILQSNQASAGLGVSVSCAGDVNGDGYSDVIVGAANFDNGQTGEGAAFIYHGSATGISTTAATMLENNQASSKFGYAVSGAGDVNGDGYSDLIVGAYLYDNGQTDEGAAFVYHGSASGINTTATSTVESNQVSGNMGNSVSCAGDVNGDGYSDVIVGAPNYDNGQTDEGATFIYHGSATGISTTANVMVESNQANAYFGFAVSGAGDVNGDGYGDVIVGARYYDNGQTNEGAAFIYHGSATGISTTANAMVESNQANAYTGWSVSGAGDVNGDGYSDVIVGIRFYDDGETDEGAAFVYHGSATGISTTAAAMLQSNQADAQLGISVFGAGDVNGDGYSDVIVGAFLYDNGQTDEGAAFVYHGSATGINTTAVWMVQSNQANAYMGIAVSGAGDVNGDGFSDVIVGANLYDNGQTDVGAAFIYHGSATGINITPAAIMEGIQTNAKLGTSVAGAGDVNGDGYSDVIAGAPTYDNGQPGEGAAFVYQGSPTGINTTPAAAVQCNQADANMGKSVSGAGDVNGDGFSDVIVGAPFYDNGQTDEGAAFVYHGGGSGINVKRNNLRLYNSDASTPINASNTTAADFGAGFYIKGFMGRTKGKLVWEVKTNGAAFSSAAGNISNSVQYTGQQASFTDLGLAGTELKSVLNKVTPGVSTKVRVRVKYNLVTSVNGQVYGPWHNVANYTQGDLDMQATPLNGSTIVKAKAYLQGAYLTASSNMTNDLNANGELSTYALAQPYNNTYFGNYAGAETVTAAFFTAHPTIVDWVLVEVRHPADYTNVMARRAAFILQDGTLMDTSGASGVAFPTITAGNYYISISHRNHLSVVSSATVALSGSSSVFDFTTGLGQGMDNGSGNGMKQIGAVWAMWSGDYNHDHSIDNLDQNLLQIQYNQGVFDGYFLGDLNFDIGVDNLDQSTLLLVYNQGIFSPLF